MFASQFKQHNSMKEFRELWLTVHVAMATMSVFNETDYPTESMIKEMENAKNDLLQIASERDYGKAIERAKEQFSENGYEMTDEIERFVLTPDQFDIRSSVIEKKERYFKKFPEYWENEIGKLKRKNAIANRRTYLIGEIERLLKEADGVSRETVERMKEYSEYNRKVLGGI